jgi:hypothetical protein
MDAMSDAIEGADVMLYGVSLAYKESANVRVASHGAFSPADVWIDAFYWVCVWLTLRVVAAAATVLQCRLEANYAHQQELDMIPLMMQADYSPMGWVTTELIMASLQPPTS